VDFVERNAEGRLSMRLLGLTMWCGKTMPAWRSEDAKAYDYGSSAIVFSLTRGRFIAGYAPSRMARRSGANG
jgi:hypothetical protein